MNNSELHSCVHVIMHQCNHTCMHSFNHAIILILNNIKNLFSTFLFFFSICALVIVFGGISSSPYSGLLTISPLLLLIEFFKGASTNVYYEIAKVLYREKDIDINIVYSRISIFVKIINYILVTTILMSVSTIIIIEIFKWSPHFNDGLFDISVFSATQWYYWTYFFIFLSSFLAALISVLPPTIFEKVIGWSDRFLTGGHDN